MDELLAASKLLGSALARYTAACCDITKVYCPDYEKQIGPDIFLDSITHELQTVSSYEIEIQTAKSVLARRRNSSRRIAPINTLPPEVLAHVFSLLCSKPQENCLTGNHDNMFDEGELENIQPLLPHIVSHVCSRWRQIAIDSHRLWSHIDIITSNRRCVRLLPRAGLYGDRATLIPLSLHIGSPEDSVIDSSESMLRQTLDTISSLAPRTRQFRFDNLQKGLGSGKWLPNMLHYFLKYADSSKLRELCLFDHDRSSMALLIPNVIADDFHADGWERVQPLWLPTCFVDKLLLPLEVLWLRNLFFPWSCHAYVGLTDLRLIADRDVSKVMWRLDYPHIHIRQLIDILSSCPRLRIFHCNLWFDTNNTQPELTVTPISLIELEVVNFQLMASKHSGYLLAHISPGGKPLELSLSVSHEREQPSGCFLLPPVLHFFSRSYVKRLFLHEDSIAGKDLLIHTPIAALLSQLPTRLRTLGLNRFMVRQGTEEPTSWPTLLKKVYIEASWVELTALQTLSRVCPLRELMLSCLPKGPWVDMEDYVEEETAKLAFSTSTSWVAPSRWKEE